MQDRDEAELPVTQTSGPGGGGLSGACAKIGVALTVPGTFGQSRGFHEACPDAFPLPLATPRACGSHHASTLGGSCLSPH